MSPDNLVDDAVPMAPDSADVWSDVLTRMAPYRGNGQSLDQWLIRLVEAIVNIPPAECDRREVEINNFFKIIDSLPNLYLPSNPAFSEADREGVRNRILAEQVIPKAKAKIHEFYPTGKYLASTLGKWINEKMRLMYACWDEFKTRHPDTSLDNYLNGANERLEWQAFAARPTLSGLDQIIAAEQARHGSSSVFTLVANASINAIAEVLRIPIFRFIDYIQNDPDQVLCSKSVRNYPNCTYQVLIQRIYLNQEKKSAIAAEFGIPYQNLNAHYTRHVCPDFINQLILEKGFFDSAVYPQLRQYIDQDPEEILQNCCMNNKPQVNAQFLAQKRLRFYSDAAPLSFDILVRDAAIAPYQLAPERLEKFWTKTACPLVARMTLPVLAYGL